MNKYYIETIFQVLTIVFGVISLAGVVVCIAADNLNLGWITTTFAVLSFTSLLAKIFFFND